MTAKKRVTSIICIISLILAITVGVLLSVEAPQSNNYYDGESVSLSNTDVTVNALTSTKKASDDDKTGAIAITNVTELQTFLKGSGSYGYLANDIEDTLDWSDIGSTVIFESGRTFDGNGFTVTIADSSSGKHTLTGGYDPMEASADGKDKGWEKAMDRNYGVFVKYNKGTIKNVKFVYNSNSGTIQDNTGDNRANYVGLVCGTNIGTIQNCDLTVSRSFTYSYQNNDQGDDYRHETYWGGIAGRNAGIIKNITAQYSGFTLNLTTKPNCRNKVAAKAIAGGIAGRNDVLQGKDITVTTEISNIIVTGDAKFALTATASKGGTQYRWYSAVVSTNSAYAGGVGDKEEQQAKVDNIIMNLNMDGSSHTYGSVHSKNSVVYCGRTSNVTILDVYGNDTYSNNNFVQHVNYQVDSCNCGVSGNPGKHSANYGNIIHTGNHSDVTVGFDAANNQVITVTPKANAILGEFSFNKFNDRGTVNNANALEAGAKDNTNYSADVPNDGTTYLYNQENIRDNEYVFTVKPYQQVGCKYWEINAYSYEIADIDNTVEKEEYTYTYTGKDFLADQLSFTAPSGKTGIAKPAGFNARNAEGAAVTEGRLPGTYTFTLQDKEAGLAYIDTENKVVAYPEATEFTFTVIPAQVIIKLDVEDTGEDIDVSEFLDPNWMKERLDFKFWLDTNIENAADGYVYEVNGSAPTTVNNLKMLNNNDTTSAGRTYKIYLTSGGVRVTEDYTYTVKIDLTDPTVEITDIEHDEAGKYYFHNKITIKATDKASGVASIKLYSDGVEKIDVMNSVEANADGTYTVKFSESGNNVIKVVDNADHSSEIPVNILIDNFTPTIDVYAYHYKMVDIPGTDDGNGNPQQELRKTAYVYDEAGMGTKSKSAVYFEVTAEFGESGGEIRYRLEDGGAWKVLASGGEGTLTATLTVKNNGAKVSFNAVSNTYNHPDSETAETGYKLARVYTLWGKSVTVNIELAKITVTLDDIEILDVTKPFDGTTDVVDAASKVTIKDGHLTTDDDGNTINGEVQITSVKYADVNVGESVALIIELSCTDDTKIVDNQIVGAVGAITKRAISVVVDRKDKKYGEALPTLTYQPVEGMIKGFEVDIPLYVQKGESNENLPYELLPQTERDDSIDGYVITVVEGTVFDNYEITKITPNLLHIDLAQIDRLVYEKGQFTGLDIYNIADRSLEIGFNKADGSYEKLVVKFYGRDRYYDSNDNLIDNGYAKEIKDITKAPAGFYKVVISLPEKDANGELLTNKYEMSDDLFLTDIVNKDKKKYNFMIKIIDASIFDKVEEEEEPAKQEPTQSSDVEQEQSAPVINNIGAQVGIYEDGSASTDSTDTTIESVQQTKDYVAMISIFCAVAILIAFAFGVGKVVAKRIKR